MPPGRPKQALHGKAHQMQKRRTQVLSMKLAGAANEQIAAQLGVTGQTVRNDLKYLYEKTERDNQYPIEQLRAIEVAKLDKLTMAMMPQALGYTDPETQHRVPPDRLAVDRVVDISARKSAILGLDAPINIKVEYQMPPELITLLQVKGITPKDMWSWVVATIKELESTATEGDSAIEAEIIPQIPASFDESADG